MVNPRNEIFSSMSQVLFAGVEDKDRLGIHNEVMASKRGCHRINATPRMPRRRNLKAKDELGGRRIVKRALTRSFPTSRRRGYYLGARTFQGTQGGHGYTEPTALHSLEYLVVYSVVWRMLPSAMEGF